MRPAWSPSAAEPAPPHANSPLPYVPLYRSNLLKMRYHSAESAQYHQAVWRHIDQRTLPLRLKVPQAEQAIRYVQQWWNVAR